MKFLLILTSLAAATLLTGADILAPYRTRAEKSYTERPKIFSWVKNCVPSSRNLPPGANRFSNRRFSSLNLYRTVSDN